MPVCRAPIAPPPPEDMWEAVNSPLARHAQVIWVPFMVGLALCTLFWIDGDLEAVRYEAESARGSSPVNK